MSFQQTKTLRPNRVRILNLPDTYTKEDINNFAKSYSGFKKADIKKSDDGKLLGLIWFDTPDIAERMAKELDGMTIENIGRINAVLDQPPPNGGKRGTRRGGSAGRPSSSPYDGQAGANGGYWAASGGSPTSQNYYGGGGYVGNNFPIVSSPAFQLALRNHTRGIRFIRMLVPRMHVGLVIGHNGSTIKEITQKSHARIDVRHEFFNRPVHPLRMGNSMVLCQVIFISGHEDECVSAIREMYGLLLKNLEANPNADAGESDSWLWLLAEDRHCGRLIGIAGKHFNAIKEKTNAQVIVGNAPQMVFHQETLEPFFGGPERSVAIRAEGAGEAIKAAGEASQLLLEKLTACRELDIKFASSNVPVDDSYPHSMYAGVLHGASASFAGGQVCTSFLLV
jgi:RNA recognition motif-containing protein